jgi:hypothetical protein
MGKQESDERKPKPEGTFRVTPDDKDDTEGHSFRKPEGTFRATPDDKDDTEDDTEGHAWRTPSPRSRGE